MARFLFTAHDPGGALMLGASHAEILSRGHDVVFAAAGPTLGVWQAAGHEVIAVDKADELPWENIDAVATGSGFSDFERDVWPLAAARQLPSLAVIDAWTSLVRRFETPNGPVQPSAVAVLDAAVRDELAAHDWWMAEMYIVGQPHLQAQTTALRLRRSQSPTRHDRPNIVFFSEPVREDYGTTRGFDQFEVFETLVRHLPQELEIGIKPHPREDAAAWARLSGDRFRLIDATAADLLVEADGVLGMTTMVLVEAHLLGLPVLSLQPGRTGLANPLIDEFCTPVLDWADFAGSWAAFNDALGQPLPVTPRFANLLADADQRLADALEAVAGLSEKD